MSKEDKWLEKRLGKITASELSNIVSASGRIIDTNVDFIRRVRWERNHGFSLPISSRAMELGKQNEPMAIEWYRANYPYSRIVYSQELPEIPFWMNPDIPNFGASPDAFTPDEMIVLEVKCVVSNGQIEFYFDPATSFEEKKARAAKEHLDQILGQFASNPKVQCVRLLKYCFQNDDILKDTDSPLAPWRGIVFEFERKDYSSSIEKMIDRIRLFNAMIESDKNPSVFKSGEWYVGQDGELKQK